jgi:hypothetical protein
VKRLPIPASTPARVAAGAWVAVVVCLVGLGLALAPTVAPWVLWGGASAVALAVAVRFTGKALDEAAIVRDADAARPDPPQRHEATAPAPLNLG